MLTYEACVHHLVQERLRIRIRTAEYPFKLLDQDPGVKIHENRNNFKKITPKMFFFYSLHATFSIRGKVPNTDTKHFGNAGSGFAYNEYGSASLGSWWLTLGSEVAHFLLQLVSLEAERHGFLQFLLKCGILALGNANNLDAAFLLGIRIFLTTNGKKLY
jgi:hypothetical protein